MALKIVARNLSKVIFYIFLSLVVGRTIGSPETWVDRDVATRIAHVIYGPGEIGADNYYDLYTYFSIIVVFSITTAIYILTMILIRRITRGRYD